MCVGVLLWRVSVSESLLCDNPWVRFLASYVPNLSIVFIVVR